MRHIVKGRGQPAPSVSLCILHHLSPRSTNLHHRHPNGVRCFLSKRLTLGLFSVLCFRSKDALEETHSSYGGTTVLTKQW